MKKIIVLFLVLISIGVKAQTTYTFATYNPLEITAPDNTNTHIIQTPANIGSDLLITFPSGNAGTVKVNTSTSTITSSPSFSYTTHPNGIIVSTNAKTGYKVYLKFTNTSDKVVVTRWQSY